MCSCPIVPRWRQGKHYPRPDVPSTPRHTFTQPSEAGSRAHAKRRLRAPDTAAPQRRHGTCRHAVTALPTRLRALWQLLPYATRRGHRATRHLRNWHVPHARQARPARRFRSEPTSDQAGCGARRFRYRGGAERRRIGTTRGCLTHARTMTVLPCRILLPDGGYRVWQVLTGGWVSVGMLCQRFVVRHAGGATFLGKFALGVLELGCYITLIYK